MRTSHFRMVQLSSIIAIITIFSQTTIVAADSNFHWGIREGRYHYHVKRSSSIYSPATGTVQNEGEWDSYIEVSDIPEDPEVPTYWGNVTYIGRTWNMYFANGTEGGYFEFRAVAIGNWTELTRFYNESFQLLHLSDMNYTFINTPNVWGYTLHWDYIPGETYSHYEYRFSKTDGVLNYYLEDLVMPLGTAYNKTLENTRIQNNLTIVLGVSVIAAIVVIALIIWRKRQH